jgi:hypothetical protein
MSNFDHIILFSLLFWLFFQVSKIPQAKLNRDYWKILGPQIVSYTLIIGLRYGWGNDWWGYRFSYSIPALKREGERGFAIINWLLQSSGANYMIATIVYAIIFLFGALFLIRGYRNNKYMLALFLPAILLFNTAMIRQAIAFAFMFIALRFLNEKNYKYAVLFGFIMLNIHGSTLMFAGVAAGFYFLQIVYKKPLPIKVTIPLYLICILFDQIIGHYIGNNLSAFISTLDVADNFKGYTEHANIWFGVDALNEAYKQSILALTLNTLSDIGVFCIGYFVLSKYPNPKVIYLYNTSTVGAILFRAGLQMELLHRMGQSLQLFYFIPLGYAFYILYAAKISLGTQKDLICKISTIFFLIFTILYYGRFIFMNPRGSFVWNH